MDDIILQFLYGEEFWIKLENLLKNAKERVFLVSAYIGKDTYEKYIKLIPNHIDCITLCRSDSSYKPEGSIVIDEKYFHGKIYLIDNTIIVGSQNLYDAQKEGEFSTLIETDSFNSSLILYQALLKIIEGNGTNLQPIEKSFFEFYENGCPFCGNINITNIVHTCLYDNAGFASDEDCENYQGEGLCASCSSENRHEINAYCCDSDGCGLGISINTQKLIKHAVDPPNKEKIELVRAYLKLFNFFYLSGANSVMVFEKLGLNGLVYKTSFNRDARYFINYDSIKEILIKSENDI